MRRVARYQPLLQSDFEREGQECVSSAGIACVSETGYAELHDDP